MIYEIFKKVVKVNGEWKDDIDVRVEELSVKEGMWVCFVCNIIMLRIKCKCINVDCCVSLEFFEK